MVKVIIFIFIEWTGYRLGVALTLCQSIQLQNEIQSFINHTVRAPHGPTNVILWNGVFAKHTIAEQKSCR